MLRKKLMALVLMGITAFGVSVSNTITTIAAPINTDTSINKLVEITRQGIEDLEKVVNEENYAKAIGYQRHSKDQLSNLREYGEDVTDLQMKFDELSDKIEVLKKKQKKINEFSQLIKDSIMDIEYSLNHKEYEYIANMFKTLSNNIDNLNKYKPIDRSTLNKVEKLKERYDKESSAYAENLIKSILTKLDNLSNLIKEKNIVSAALVENQVELDIAKLAKLSTVPDFIKNNFILYSDQLDNLYKLKDEGEKLNIKIRSLIDEAEKFMDIKDFDNAKKCLDEALIKNGRLYVIDHVDAVLTIRLKTIIKKFDKLDYTEKIVPDRPYSPVNVDVEPIIPEEKPMDLEWDDEFAEQPMNLEEQPIILEEKPMDLEWDDEFAEQPMNLEEQPIVSEVQPMNLEEQPIVSEVQPMNLEEQPIHLEVKRMDKEIEPKDIDKELLELEGRLTHLEAELKDLKEEPMNLEEQLIDLEEQLMDLEDQLINEVHPMYLEGQPVINTPENSPSNSKKSTQLENINLDSQNNDKQKEESIFTKLVDAKKNNESKEAIDATKLIDANKVDESNEEVKSIKLVDDKEDDTEVLNEISNQGKATTTINVLPKTGNRISGEGLLGMGAAASALGALALKMFRKN